MTVNEVINYAHTFVKKEPLHTRGSNITVTVCTDVCIAGVCLFLYSVEEDIFMCSVVLLHVNVFEGKINCFSQRPLKINVSSVTMRKMNILFNNPEKIFSFLIHASMTDSYIS